MNRDELAQSLGFKNGEDWDISIVADKKADAFFIDLVTRYNLDIPDGARDEIKEFFRAFVKVFSQK